MNVTRLAPPLVERVQFARKFYSRIPPAPGCYALTTLEGEVLYVGKATTLSERFEQHLDDPEKVGATTDGVAFWFYFSQFDLNELEKVERSWMNEFLLEHAKLPVMNKIYSPVI